MTDADHESIVQNLTDAGCDKETAARVLDCLQREDLSGAKRALAAHREKLLSAYHTQARRIDCLDYLLYRLEPNAACKGKRRHN